MKMGYDYAYPIHYYIASTYFRYHPGGYRRSHHPRHVRAHRVHQQEVLRVRIPAPLLLRYAAIGTADTPAEPISTIFVLTAQVHQFRHQQAPGRRPDTKGNHTQQQNAQRLRLQELVRHQFCAHRQPGGRWSRY